MASASVSLARQEQVAPLLLRRLWPHAIILAAFFLITVIGQVWSGAYARGVGEYWDEPAHFMSGLLVRDYIAAGMPSPPLTYARNYYNHLPTLGIGYWPPAFYVIEGVWMLVFGISRTSVLLLIALIAASLQYLLFRAARSELGALSAAVVATSFGIVPVVRYSNAMVMTDVFVSLMCFAAVLAFIKHLRVASVRSGVLFGLMASLAILSKSSALFLIFLPPLSILVSRNWELLKRRSTWMSAIIVAAICGLWFVPMHEYVTVGLMPVMPAGYWLIAWKSYVSLTIETLGPIVPVFAIIGGFIALRSAKANPRWAPILALPVAVLLFLMLAPVTLESRYLVVTLPCVLMLTALAVRRFAWSAGVRGDLGIAALTAIVLASVLLAEWPSSDRLRDGIEEAASFVSRVAPPDAVLLASSPMTEGRIVAQLAIREPHRPGRSVLRAYKVLAETDWNATFYRQRLTREDEVRRELRDRRVNYVLMYFAPKSVAPAHHELLYRSLSNSAGEWNPAATFVGDAGRKCIVFTRRDTKTAG